MLSELEDDAVFMHDEPHLVVEPSAEATVLARLMGGGTEKEGAAAVVAHTYGKGRAVYLPGRLDAIQCRRLTPAFERLVVGAVRWAAGGHVPVEVTAEAPVSVSLFDQPDRRVVHLVNLNGDSTFASDRIEPQDDVRVCLAVPEGRRVQHIRRLWDEGELEFTDDDGSIRFTLPRLGYYEAVAVELRRE